MLFKSLKNKKIKKGGKRNKRETKKNFIPTFLSLQCLLVLYFYLRYYKNNFLKSQDLSNKLTLDNYRQNFKSITNISEANSIIDQCHKNINIFHKLFVNNKLSSYKFYHLILLDLKNLNKIITLISEQININQKISFNIQDLSIILKDYQKICQLLNLSLTQMNKIKLEIDVCQENLNNLLDKNPDILKKDKPTKSLSFLDDIITSIKNNSKVLSENKSSPLKSSPKDSSSLKTQKKKNRWFYKSIKIIKFIFLQRIPHKKCITARRR